MVYINLNLSLINLCTYVLRVINISGTSEYTQGFVEHVTVLVGVAIGKRAVGGVIHQPYYKNSENDVLGRTLWGINGVGFGGFTPIVAPAGKRIVTTTRYDLVWN